MAASTGGKLSAATLLAYASLASAACNPTGSYTFTGACNEGSLNAALGADCLQELGLDASEVCDSLAFPFSEISGKGYHHDKSYFDGGSEWNLNDGEEGVKNVEMGQVARFEANMAGTHQVGWPAYRTAYLNADGNQSPAPSNFDACAKNTVMCCFVHNRFENADLDAQAEVCYHDLESAAESNHVERGFTTFSGPERNTYCTGFTWEDDSVADRFKGNTLYASSMKKTFQDGFVKNIPGAPLCGCIEQMPVVTAAACLDVTVTGEKGTLELNKEEGTVVGDVSGTISHAACSDGDLKASAAAKGQDLSSNIVSDCTDSTNAALNEEFYVPDEEGITTYQYINENEWTQFAGRGIFFHPYGLTLEDGNEDLKAQLAASPNNIIYRYCPDCEPSHVHLYYKRLTPLSSEVNFLSQLLNAWNTTDNVLHTDYLLFNDYEEAKTGNVNSTASFQFCPDKESTDKGFPELSLIHI